MTVDDLRLLKDNVGKHVRIFCTDGETIVAKIHVVSDEDQDVIYDIVSTTRPKRAAVHGGEPAYLVSFGEIERVEPA